MIESRTKRLAADIGGTFTDVAALDEATGKLLLGKTLSTPRRLITGITTAVRDAGTKFADANLFLHGSTVAINTLLERNGARTALLTTEVSAMPMKSAVSTDPTPIIYISKSMFRWSSGRCGTKSSKE